MSNRDINIECLLNKNSVDGSIWDIHYFKSSAISFSIKMLKLDKVNPEGIEAARAWFNEYSLLDYYSQMIKAEREFHNFDILKIQNSITVDDRAKLISWIIQLCCSNVFESMHKVGLRLFLEKAISSDFLNFCHNRFK